MENKANQSTIKNFLNSKESKFDLNWLFSTLWRSKWTIITIIVLFLFLAIVYLFFLRPSYQANVLLKIQSGDSLPLQRELSTGADSLGGAQISPGEAEIPFITARSVVESTVKKLGLQNTVEPLHFPIIGSRVAAKSEIQGSLKSGGIVKYRSVFPAYVWEKAHISLKSFEVPDKYKGKPFRIRVVGRNEYILLDKDGHVLLKGKAGKKISKHVENIGHISIYIDSIIASSAPADFIIKHDHWLTAVKDLQSQLEIEEVGNGTGAISLSLQGNDRDKITEILNSLAKDYLSRNVESRSKQAEKSLDFLNSQLPDLKKELEKAEDRLTKYRESANNSLDLTSESQTLLQQSVNLENQISDLQLNISELKQAYTENHPNLRTARQKMSELQERHRKLEKRIKGLPDTQKTLLSLQRDVNVSTQLYTSLRQRAQELRVAKAGTVSNAQIYDRAVKPVKPLSVNTKLILLGTIILGGIIGSSLILARIAFSPGMRDPEELEEKLGLPVKAVIPFSGWLLKANKNAKLFSQPRAILARDNEGDPSLEGLYNLRTNLHLNQLNNTSKTTLIGGASPDIGKSFISTNLAYLIAEVGRKVIVIDADLHQGKQHQFLSTQKQIPGLSEILSGEVDWQATLQKFKDSDVSVIPSGSYPKKPSTLLMNGQLANLISELQDHFDRIIIDLPPTLGTADVAIIAMAVPDAAIYLVGRAGVSKISELQQTIKEFNAQDRTISGIIFNGLKRSHTLGTNYYQYYYGY